MSLDSIVHVLDLETIDLDLFRSVDNLWKPKRGRGVFGMDEREVPSSGKKKKRGCGAVTLGRRERGKQRGSESSSKLIERDKRRELLVPYVGKCVVTLRWQQGLKGERERDTRCYHNWEAV